MDEFKPFTLSSLLGECVRAFIIWRIAFMGNLIVEHTQHTQCCGNANQFNDDQNDKNFVRIINFKMPERHTRDVCVWEKDFLLRSWADAALSVNWFSYLQLFFRRFAAMCFHSHT